MPLKDPCSDRPRNGEFFYLLAELFFQCLLLLFAEAKPEDPKFIQRPFGEINLTELKTDLFLDLGNLLLGQLKLNDLFHQENPP